MSNTNQCFLSKEECIEKDNKYFNNKCNILSCPENTNEKNSDGMCYCSYYYFHDIENDLYICFGENE